jgi:hypothetical protein
MWQQALIMIMEKLFIPINQDWELITGVFFRNIDARNDPFDSIQTRNRQSEF